MNKLEIKINSYEQMIELGNILASFAYPNLVIALNGDLGAGKTTFTKGIGKALGINRVINSPTFTIMKVYEPTNKLNGIQMLYHLDVYRIENASDDFELEEYFDLDGLTVVEWAQIIDELLPHNLWNVFILNETESTRKFIIEFNDDTIVENVVTTLKENGYEVIY